MEAYYFLPLESPCSYLTLLMILKCYVVRVPVQTSVRGLQAVGLSNKQQQWLDLKPGTNVRDEHQMTSVMDSKVQSQSIGPARPRCLSPGKLGWQLRLGIWKACLSLTLRMRIQRRIEERRPATHRPLALQEPPYSKGACSMLR